MALRVAELETIFVADIKDFTKKAEAVDRAQRALAGADPTITVGSDVRSALTDLARVQDGARDIDSTTASATLDADATSALGSIGSAADALARIDGDTATFSVAADTSRAEADIRGLGDEGEAAGETAGEGLSSGIIAALVALPVAGTIVGIGAAIGKSIMEGLDVEVRSDALMAKTGLDEKTVAVLARASGEAYANNFGESLAGNMDTARQAIQQGLLDPKGTAKDSQAVIESLSGVADILGEEIPAVARATAQILRTGLAKDAAGAFDLLVKGAQAGVDKSEDLLDTFNEYSVQFQKVGLEGPEALGLMSQAIKGGARDSDIAADAIKEFTLRSLGALEKFDSKGVSHLTDLGAAFVGLGLDGEKMQDDIASGGSRASAALGKVFTALRGVEDPATRAQIAVSLFGTQSEDMAGALNKMDLSTAVKELGTVEGAAGNAMAAIGTNTAATLETARRNIEVAADGIKGALAAAFAPQIEGFAAFATENRAAIMQFLLDMANGALDAGRALANAAADGIEGFGHMVGFVGPAVMGLIGSILRGLDSIPGVDMSESVENFEKLQTKADASFAAVDKGSQKAAASIRTNLIKNGLDVAQAKLKSTAAPLIDQAKLHDASLRVAKGIDGIGYAADGSGKKLDIHKGAIDRTTSAGRTLDTQIKASVASLDAETAAAGRTGESQKDLTARYAAGREALVKQLTQMGFTATAAGKLADEYGAIPKQKVTNIVLNKRDAAAKITALQKQINDIKQGKKPGLSLNSVQGQAVIAGLQRQIATLKRQISAPVTVPIKVKLDATSMSILSALTGVPVFAIPSAPKAKRKADGGTIYAANGMDRQSMIAPGGSNILWAEPETGWETYISGKPSQRARNIRLLEETARRFGLGIMPMANGGVFGQQPAMAGATSTTHSTSIVHTGNIIAPDPDAYRARMAREARMHALRSH
jgi:hypothetical protein